MKTFIESYRNSDYYNKLFDVDSDIIIIYVGGSYSFKTNHEASDYDINVVTNGGEFFSVYLDWHLKYKHRTVHWYYRPIVDFFKLICYDLHDYIGVMTLMNIPEENIIYLNPKYEQQWKHLYENRDRLLKHMCIELGLSCKSYINFILKADEIKATRDRTQRIYFICIAAYFLLGISPDYQLLKAISRSKRLELPFKAEELIQIKELLQKYLTALEGFDLVENRNELRSLESEFKF